MRTEGEAIVEAMREVFQVGRQCQVPVVISHLKCAGVANWGRSGEILNTLDTARAEQPVQCDCYPYAASSSTLDIRQVDERVRIVITWSKPHPEIAGQTLEQIALAWGVPQRQAAERLQPAGAIYHCMSEEDVRRILQHPATMIGSDGLPHDPLPHPRLWGTFPRVLGYYCREQGLFPLANAVHKMTGMPAQRFGLDGRGCIREGAHADLVLFDPETIKDTATFTNPICCAEGSRRFGSTAYCPIRTGMPPGSEADAFCLARAGDNEPSQSGSLPPMIDSHGLYLLIAAATSVVVLILLIAVVKLNPFLSLLTVSLALAVATGMRLETIVGSFETGTGNTLGHIAIVVGLGTMLGKMMAESGASDRIAETLIHLFGERYVPWSMLCASLIVGLPVFFEVGFVLLVPIVFTVARRTRTSLVLVGLPMLAGLSVDHALVPPHPAAMLAVTIFHADVGRTILFALLIGIPTAAIAGPIYARWIAPRLVLSEHNPMAEEFLEHATIAVCPALAWP